MKTVDVIPHSHPSLDDEEIRECLERREAALTAAEGRAPDARRVEEFLDRLEHDGSTKRLARRPGPLVVLYSLYRETRRMPPFEGDALDQIAQARLTGPGPA